MLCYTISATTLLSLSKLSNCLIDCAPVKNTFTLIHDTCILYWKKEKNSSCKSQICKPVCYLFLPAVFWRSVKKIFLLAKEWQEKKQMHKCLWMKKSMDIYLMQFPFLIHSSVPQIYHAILAPLSLAKSEIAFKALCTPVQPVSVNIVMAKAQFRELSTRKNK